MEQKTGTKTLNSLHPENFHRAFFTKPEGAVYQLGPENVHINLTESIIISMQNKTNMNSENNCFTSFLLSWHRN